MLHQSHYLLLLLAGIPGLVVDVAPGEGDCPMSRQVQVGHTRTRQRDLVKPIAHDLLLYTVHTIHDHKIAKQ